MANIEKLRENLERRGFKTSYFETAQEAVDYLDKEIDGVSVGIGGSMTVKAIGLYDRLKAHNEMHWHWEGGTLEDAALAHTYISSANAVAETGEIINIDGNGNRVASLIFKHNKIYIIIGVNKIEPDFDKALWRARNVAAPKRAQSMNAKTPCAAKADKCYDCNSLGRICRSLTVLWGKSMMESQDTEVVIINDEFGM